MANRKRRWRTRKLVDRKMQLKIVGLFVSFVVMSAAIQMWLVFAEVRGMQRADGMVDASVLLRSALGTCALAVAAVCPVAFLVALLATHRVAGPAFRMCRHLEAVARGENPGTCRIREKDELQELCGKLNLALEAMERRAARGETHTGEPAEPLVEPSEPVQEPGTV